MSHRSAHPPAQVDIQRQLRRPSAFDLESVSVTSAAGWSGVSGVVRQEGLGLTTPDQRSHLRGCPAWRNPTRPWGRRLPIPVKRGLDVRAGAVAAAEGLGARLPGVVHSEL